MRHDMPISDLHFKALSFLLDVKGARTVLSTNAQTLWDLETFGKPGKTVELGASPFPRSQMVMSMSLEKGLCDSMATMGPG